MATDLINRDPFCRVQLSPLLDSRGNETETVRVEMEDEEGNWQPLAGKSAIHGRDYTLVHNQQVFDTVGDILTRADGTFTPVPHKHQFWNGKSFSAKWYNKDIAADVGNSTIALGVEAVNSYDGSAPVGIRFFAMHYICANQFYLRNVLGNFVFKHVSREAGIALGDNIDDTLALMRKQAHRFMDMVPYVRELRERRVENLEGFLEFRAQANKEFWRPSYDGAVLDELYGNGITSELGMDTTKSAPVNSYWRILNAYTAVCTHKIGGFNGASLSDAAAQYTFKHAGIQFDNALTVA